MRTLQRATAAVIYPAILCLGVACERTDTPTASVSVRGPQADLSASYLMRQLLLKFEPIGL